MGSSFVLEPIDFQSIDKNSNKNTQHPSYTLKPIYNTFFFQSENQWVFMRKWHADFLSSSSEVTFILSEQEKGNSDIKPHCVFMRSLLHLGGLGVVMIDWHDRVCMLRWTQERYSIVGRTGRRFSFNVRGVRIWINPQDTYSWAKALHSRIPSQHQYSINDAQINHIYLSDCSSNAQQDRSLFYVKTTLGYLHFFVNMGINTWDLTSNPNKSCRLSYLVQDVINMIKLRRQMSRGGLVLCSSSVPDPLKVLLACLQVTLYIESLLTLSNTHPNPNHRAGTSSHLFL